jgi:hypothetical protein
VFAIATWVGLVLFVIAYERSNGPYVRGLDQQSYPDRRKRIFIDMAVLAVSGGLAELLAEQVGDRNWLAAGVAGAVLLAAFYLWFLRTRMTIAYRRGERG